VKKLLFIAAILISLTSCSQVNNQSSERVFKAINFSIYRVNIKGINYLVNSRGGIIEEVIQ